MKRWKKILLGGLGVFTGLLLAVIAILGPWPVYSSTNFEKSSYYQEALSRIDAAAQESNVTSQPAPLQAGWAVRTITPPSGAPLAGYGDRNGAPSTGVHDDLHAKAVALSDGKDTVVLVGADLLLMPPEATELANMEVAAKTSVRPSHILYHASHTHCGPGGMVPGIIAKMAMGQYNPEVPKVLAKAFSEAIIEAVQNLKPAKLGHGTVDAAQYIRNRTREAGVDPTLNVARIEQDGGARCYMVRFSGHPTIYGGDMMQFSAEYPGALQRSIEKETGGTAVYLGGAVGSMSVRAPEGTSAEARVEATGQILAKLALEKASALTMESAVDIASMSVSVKMPPAQWRPVSSSWRISPVFSHWAGMDGKAALQCARIGSMMVAGASFDFSGEVSLAWQNWAREHQWDLWVTSFAPGYCGYLSPDRYYGEHDKKGGMGYEIGLMNWYGPDTETYMTQLFEHAATELSDKQGAVATAR